MLQIKDWAVIVTGSATGIGAAAAEQLAGLGANVVINYTRSQAEAKETQAACEALGARTLLCQADVADDAQCRRMAAEAFEHFGRLDGLINNAGTTAFAAHDDLEALSAEDFRRIYDVNVIGVYQMTRATVDYLRRDAGGRGMSAGIVNTSSIAGTMGVGSSIAYAASKGALNTMTLSLARALGPDIRVNTVCPGFVQGRWLRGGMGDELYERQVRAMEETTPLRRAGTPEDMASTALWLMAGNANMTGQIVTCDSGTSLGQAPLQRK